MDIVECAKRCTSDSRCLAFAYDRWNRSCYPKSAFSGSILDPRSMIAVKKPGEIPRVSQKESQIDTLRNKRMHGAPNRTLRVDNFDACKRTCNEELLCVAFNFLKRTSGVNCEMYKISEGYDGDSSVDAGYKYQAP
ncbi:PAN domain-containing protein [Bradyrhizobium sp. th.b2]|uniref:PAN domain-containing protein n=1 Tax=Bradyrhizobium sp. th-b2 TaxID=172088 RepID=UPI00352922F7